jgi:phospholipase C
MKKANINSIPKRAVNKTFKVPVKIPIKHIVIVFKENHGFDNYFGTFPGANSLSLICY